MTCVSDSSEHKPFLRDTDSMATESENGGTTPTEVQDKVDVSCGLAGCRTNLMGRRFANLYVFSILMGISIMFSRMVSEILGIQLASMEKQFNIDNSKAGLLVTATMAGQTSTLFWAGHFVKGLHIPVIIGVSGIFQGLVLTIPSFLQFANPYTLPDDHSTAIPGGGFSTDNGQLCLPSNSGVIENITTGPPGDPDALPAADTMAYNVILIVSVITGMTSTFHSGFLPSIYIDDNVLNKSKVAVFMGIQLVIVVFAAPLGREISGIFTEIPVDFKDTDMKPDDPRFVSAWWLAYLVFGIGLAVTSFPIMLMPRRLISHRQQQQALQKATVTFAGGNGDEVQYYESFENSVNSRSQRASVPKTATGKTSENEDRQSFTSDPPDTSLFAKFKSFWVLIKDFPQAALRLLKIPAYTIILVDIALISIPTNGIGAFKQAYMMYEFDVSMKHVADYSALTMLVSGVIGTLISACVATRVKTTTGYLWIQFGTYLVATAVCPLYILLGCDNVYVYGLKDKQFGIPVNTSLANCSCLPGNLLACGDDGNNYISPCFAGCTHMDNTMFTDCRLLQGNVTGDGHVTPGLCSAGAECHRNFAVYVILHGVQWMVENMSAVPRNLVTLRMVEPKDRAFAVALISMVYNCVSLPAPNVFGSLMDSMCLAKRGEYCMLYNRDHIRYLIGAVDISIHVLTQIIVLLLIIATKHRQRKQVRDRKKKLNKD